MQAQDCILHIQDNCVRIQQFVGDLTYPEYLDNFQVSYAVERAVLIISEAARRYESTTAKQPDSVNFIEMIGQRDWNRIRAVGNILRHEYDHVEDVIMWEVIVKSVPELLIHCRNYFGSSGIDSGNL